MSGGSINRRLLLGGLLLVPLFLGMAGWALERAHQQSVESALEAQLQAHLTTLLAAADDDSNGKLLLPAQLGVADFDRPDSGLYAQLIEPAGDVRWQSASWIGRNALKVPTVAVGIHQRSRTNGLHVRNSGIGWSDFDGKEHHYVLQIALDALPWEQQNASFRQQLWLWLGIAGGLLLIAVLLLVRWGLKPLNQIAHQVEQLESGEQSEIEGPIADELRPLADNLQALLALTASRQERLRNSLADLSHSLKTPLAILRSGEGALDRELVEQQVQRIDEIVSYQRQQASIAGHSNLIARTEIAPTAERLCASLVKLYPEPPRQYEVALPDDFKLRIDPGDLMELLGNLLENAFRHAHSRVRVSQQEQALLIEDDGPGFPPEQAERLLQRGQRADEQHPGQGIGLAVCQAIVGQYKGTLTLGSSEWGGGAIRIELAL